MASKAPAAVAVAAVVREQQGYARVVDDYDEEDERTLQRRRCKRVGAKCLQYTFSTAGLGLLTVAYVVAGAFAFGAIELPLEKESCQSSEDSYMEAENESTAIVLLNVRRFNGTLFKSDDQRAEVEGEILEALRNFSVTSLAIGYNYSSLCSTIDSPGGRQPKWSLLGALFFSITVVTTIGYGNFTPKSAGGQVLCMFYALVGIPIMLAWLANLTELMANIFRFVYATFCCCGCLVQTDNSEEDDRPQPPLPTPPTTTGAASSKTVWVTDATGRPIEKVINAPAPAAASLAARAASPSSQSDDAADDDCSADDEDDDEEETVSVPLTVAIVTLLTYVAIGGSVFSVLNNSWTYVNAFYFAFVTTATIGFGDLTPDYQGDITKIMINNFLMVFGIAMLGMCFQLLQDELVTKIRWLASKFKGQSKQKDGDASLLDGSVKA